MDLINTPTNHSPIYERKFSETQQCLSLLKKQQNKLLFLSGMLMSKIQSLEPDYVLDERFNILYNEDWMLDNEEWMKWVDEPNYDNILDGLYKDPSSFTYHIKPDHMQYAHINILYTFLANKKDPEFISNTEPVFIQKTLVLQIYKSNLTTILVLLIKVTQYIKAMTAIVNRLNKSNKSKNPDSDFMKLYNCIKRLSELAHPILTTSGKIYIGHNIPLIIYKFPNDAMTDRQILMFANDEYWGNMYIDQQNIQVLIAQIIGDLTDCMTLEKQPSSTNENRDTQPQTLNKHQT